jgi:hypothetical protein
MFGFKKILLLELRSCELFPMPFLVAGECPFALPLYPLDTGYVCRGE